MDKAEIERRAQDLKAWTKQQWGQAKPYLATAMTAGALGLLAGGVLGLRCERTTGAALVDINRDGHPDVVTRTNDPLWENQQLFIYNPQTDSTVARPELIDAFRRRAVREAEEQIETLDSLYRHRADSVF